MTGRLYVDGEDAYKEWGVYAVKDAWNELVAFAPLKSVTSNEWQEEDGIEADLSEPRLDTKEVSVKFAYAGLYSRLPEFVAYLSDRAYHRFEIPGIGREFTLRLTQMPNLDYAKAMGFATLKFANDFPMDEGEYLTPISSVARCEDYLLDGRPFTDYGCRVLKGTLSEIMKTPQVKPNLMRNIGTNHGAEYDAAGAVQFKAKDVKITLLMRALTLPELWRNYRALLRDLIRPEERTLYVEDLGQGFPFYYKSASVAEFYPTDKIWLKFTLTLCFTRDFRIEDSDVVLASEAADIVFTQDDLNAIEMKPDKANGVRLVNNHTTLRLTGGGAIRFNN